MNSHPKDTDDMTTMTAAEQDTAGPLTPTVAEAAQLLTAPIVKVINLYLLCYAFIANKCP